MTGAPLPFLLLVGFGLAFAAAALGGGPLVFDDHPGQMFRLWHGLTRNLWPWEWNPGWWGGYPELQFYPPGFVYLGALIYYGALGLLSPMTVYQVLLWIIYLLPGVTAFWLLARILPNPWLALPGAFVTLTLSAGTRSGVEEGLRWGLIAARLAWGLLPLLALSLVRWQERGDPGHPRVSRAARPGVPAPSALSRRGRFPPRRLLLTALSVAVRPESWRSPATPGPNAPLTPPSSALYQE